MPIGNYRVLKGRAIDRRLGAGASPHYQILVSDGDKLHRVAVNVQSKLAPSALEYAIVSNFRHPLLDQLEALGAHGVHNLATRPGGAALDYIRGNLFMPEIMQPLPFSVPGPDNDLNEKIDHYVQRAMADETALVCAFGETWGPEQQRDKYFGFTPGSGIHNVHMNQGNVGRFVGDDGVWQDGGLLFHFPQTQQWVAVFLKFQSQAWHTDDQTGHRLKEGAGGPPADHTEPDQPFQPGSLPTAAHPDGLVRIVAALVNDTNSPERETVTLLNRSNRAVPLAGWKLLDRMKRTQALSGELVPGMARTFEILKPLELSNRGGIITLINDDGLKVDGVAYTRAQARNPGWTIVF